MSTVPMPAAKRHALALPAGSVRAIHVLGIVGVVCAMILMPDSPTIPPYLIYLVFLMIGHYFAAHGVTIATRDEPTPSLPKAPIRTVPTTTFPRETPSFKPQPAGAAARSDHGGHVPIHIPFHGKSKDDD